MHKSQVDEKLVRVDSLFACVGLREQPEVIWLTGKLLSTQPSCRTPTIKKKNMYY